MFTCDHDGQMVLGDEDSITSIHRCTKRITNHSASNSPAWCRAVFAGLLPSRSVTDTTPMEACVLATRVQYVTKATNTVRLTLWAEEHQSPLTILQWGAVAHQMTLHDKMR